MIDILLAGLSIPTQCFEQTFSFYHQVLGLSVRHQGDGVAVLWIGDTSLVIQSVNAGNEFFPTGHGICINLTAHNLGEIRERLAANGFTPQQETPHTVLVADPNGNLIDLLGIDTYVLDKATTVELKIQGGTSCLREIQLLMARLETPFKARGIPDELRQETIALQTKLGVILNSGMQLRSRKYNPEEGDLETQYQVFWSELVELSTSLYRLVNAMIQIPGISFDEKVYETVDILKRLLDEVPTLPR
jgi:predicted enzyme related to lactoylglutathione lyase